jgi:hypothetical protein
MNSSLYKPQQAYYADPGEDDPMGGGYQDEYLAN